MKQKTKQPPAYLLFQNSNMRAIYKPAITLMTPSGNYVYEDWEIAFEIADHDSLGDLQWLPCEEDFVLPNLSTPSGWQELLKIAEGVVAGLKKVKE